MARLIEVTKDKEVVWTCHHAEAYGTSMSTGDTAVSQVLESW